MTNHTTEQLIELGRDREAIEAATQQRAGDGVDQLDEILPMLEALVANISADQLDLPSPCAKYTVAGVLEHMIGGAIHFSPAFRGEASGITVTGTPQERFQLAMTELHGALHAAGARERIIATPFGEVPGAVFARYTAFDGLVHGWDLSTSTGQAYAPRDVLVAEVDAFARSLVGPDLRDGDTFAAAVDAPVDATPLQRLVAFSGRRV